MNIFEIESEREKIFILFSSHNTPRLLLYHLSIYFQNILDSENESLIDVYLKEFLPDYKRLLKSFEIQGIPISITETIITIGERVSRNLHSQELAESLSSLNRKLIELKDALNGIVHSESYNGGLSFPVLENVYLDGKAIGGLEFIEITIKQRADLLDDEFVLVPTHLSIDERLEKQINNSWQIACKSSRRYIKKIKERHEVIIKFQKRFGYYEGNSLGVVLAIAFLKEILKFYNSRYLVLPLPDISATGSLDKSGNTKMLGKEIIQNKTEVVFYSKIKRFLVPKEDESYAIEKLNELKKNYPKRNLSLAGIESLEDVLDRRNILKIKKENNAVWIYKKITSNKMALAVIVLSLFIVGYFLFWQFDDNPAILEFQPSNILVKNEAGNLLWKKEIYTEPIYYLSEDPIKRTKARFVNVDDDEMYELLITSEMNRADSTGGISCYDSDGKELWYYYFRDNVETRIEKFSSIYSLGKIIDIYQKDSSPEILLAGQHINFYPTPFVKLNGKGEQIDDVFWHPGGSRGGFLKDIDDDGKVELVASAISNGFERCVLFSIEYDKLKGTAPTTENYRFLGLKTADFDHYILLPKSDYNMAKNYRYNSPYPPTIFNDEKVGVYLDEDRKNIYRGEGFVVIFEKDFSNPNIIVADDFRTLRDSLVVKGILNSPLTDTPEYANILKDQIRYWNGKEFITHDEYFETVISKQ